MSFELPTQRTKTAVLPRWSGAAFLVEAMLLLVFVMASLAVFTQLFAASSESVNQSKDLTDAVAIASTTAERFAADPLSVASEFEYGDLHVVCDIQSEARDGGTMYYAQIDVYEPTRSSSNLSGTLGSPDSPDSPNAYGQSIYSISTAKYESGV